MALVVVPLHLESGSASIPLFAGPMTNTADMRCYPYAADEGFFRFVPGAPPETSLIFGHLALGRLAQPGYLAHVATPAVAQRAAATASLRFVLLQATRKPAWT